jgi:predicted MFS family arabinose efflux permease
LISDHQGIGLSQGVDVLGSILVTLALMVGIYAIVESPAYGWTSVHTLGFGGAAVGLLALFAVLQARLRNPIMPLRILRLGGLVSSSAVRGLTQTGLFASFFFSAPLLERVLGYGPLQTGVAFLAQTLAVGALSMGVTPRLTQRFGLRRTLSGGLVARTVGLGLLASANDQAAYFPGLFIAFALLGIGAGTSFMPLLTIALAEVPAEDAGLASGIVNVSMQISAALGLAISAASRPSIPAR